MNKLSAFILSIIILLSSVTVFCADEQQFAAAAPVEKYDNSLGQYTETFAGGRQFLPTVPNNGKTYDAVILDVPEKTDIIVKCDGRTVFFDDSQPIYDPGYYTVEINAPHIVSGENTKTLFVFRIVGKPQAFVYNGEYKCGEILCVPTLEGEEQNGMHLYRFPNYKCFYSSLDEGEKEVSGAVFSFPPNVGYRFYKNGAPISFRQNEMINTPGNYRMEVYAKNYGTSEGYEAVYKAVMEFVIPSPDTSDETEVQQAFSPLLNTVSNSSLSTDNAAVSDTENTDISSRYEAPETVSPSVEEEKENLYESYNESAEMYKEEFSSGDGFYTNTANGDISGGNVYIDIPANISVTMKKDGVETVFENKTYIDDSGTYMLYLTDNFGTRKLSAVYSFRIQDGMESSVIPEEERSNVSVDDDFFSTFNFTFDREMNRFAYNMGDGIVYTNIPSGMFSNEGLELSMPDNVTVTAEKDGEEYPIEGDEITENGSYILTFKDDRDSTLSLNFYLYNRPVNSFEDYTVPDGYVITGMVYEDYKNTYLKETEETTAEDDAEEENSDLEENTEEETETTTQDIISEEQIESDMEMLSELSQEAEMFGVTYIKMPLDGKYSLTMEGPEGMPTLQTDIMVDRTVPEVTFEGLDENNVSTGNNFTLSCEEEDVTLVLYRKKGDQEILSETGGTFTVKGVDEYTVTAIDQAGNESSYQVRIKRHIGAAGVGSIVLLVLLIAALIGFVLYNSKKFSVR